MRRTYRLPPVGMPRWHAIYVPYKIGQAIISTIVPMMILSLGGSGSTVGLASMIFSLVSMGFSIVWGTLSDKRELRKPFILMGIGGNILCLLLLSVSVTHLFVLACYALCAVLMAAEAPITPVYLLRGSHKSEWDETLGKFNALCGWSWVAGLAIGAFLVTSLSLSLIALATALIMALSFVAALVGMRDAPICIIRPRIAIRTTYMVERKRFVPNFILHLPRIPRFKSDNNRMLFLAATLLYIGSNLIYIPVIPYLTDYGLGNSTIFAIIIANSLGSALAYPRIANAIKMNGCIPPLRRGILLRISVIGVLLISMAVPRPYALWVFCIGFSFVGVTWPGMYIPLVSFVSRAADEHTRGGLMGKYNFVSTFGLMAGSILAGTLYDSMAFVASLVCSALMFILSLAVIIWKVHEPP